MTKEVATKLWHCLKLEDVAIVTHINQTEKEGDRKEDDKQEEAAANTLVFRHWDEDESKESETRGVANCCPWKEIEQRQQV